MAKLIRYFCLRRSFPRKVCFELVSDELSESMASLFSYITHVSMIMLNSSNNKLQRGTELLRRDMPS